MTARREVPLTGDSLAWVHSELAEIKSRLALVQQAVEQSRGLAADAAEKASSLRCKVEQAETQAYLRGAADKGAGFGLTLGDIVRQSRRK